MEVRAFSGKARIRPFTCNPGPKLLAGPAQAEVLPEKLPPGPCFFVTDKDLMSLELPDAYLRAVDAKRELILFNSVEADPSKEILVGAIARLSLKPWNITRIFEPAGDRPQLRERTTKRAPANEITMGYSSAVAFRGTGISSVST